MGNCSDIVSLLCLLNHLVSDTDSLLVKGQIIESWNKSSNYQLNLILIEQGKELNKDIVSFDVMCHEFEIVLGSIEDDFFLFGERHNFEESLHRVSANVMARHSHKFRS